MKAIEFDEKFDSGLAILSDLDLDAIKRPGLEQTQFEMNLPVWMLESIDKEASRLGVSRQDMVKFWLAECLQHTR